jgi:hypothetical protein
MAQVQLKRPASQQLGASLDDGMTQEGRPRDVVD